MTLQTHLKIDERLSGRVTALRERYARVVLHTSELMTADAEGLIHGGFLFSAADYAAMAAVNDPYVVLGSSEVRFLTPVAKGQSVDFEAVVTEERGKKRVVSVVGMCDGLRVFEGVFTAFVLEGHVLGN